MSTLPNEVLMALDSICDSNVEKMKRAERELTAWASSKDTKYIELLFEIVNGGVSTSSGRLVACIQLRNIVKRSLNELQNLEAGAIQDENVVKVAMDKVVTTCVTLSNGQDQLLSYMLEIVKLIADDYFPQDWPEPLSFLMTSFVVPFYTTASATVGNPSGIAAIQPQVMQKTVTAFLVLKECFSKYDYVSNTPELMSNLAKVLHFCQTPILNCLKLAAVVLAKCPMNTPRMYQWWMSICTSALQCIVSFHHVDLPEYFEDHLQELMEVVNHCLLISVTDPNIDRIEDKKTDTPYASDVLKSTCCKLLYCYVSRYTDEFQPHIVGMTVGLVNCLDKLPVESHTEDVFTQGLDVLKKAAYYRWPDEIYPFNPNTETGSAALRTVLNGIIPKLMLLKTEDLQDIEDDPTLFIQRDIEGQQRATRREILRELISTLITRQPNVVGPELVSLCGRCISQQADPLSQECACFLLSAICTETQTRARGVTKIRGETDMMRFIETKVLPTLTTPTKATEAGEVLIHATYFKFATLFRNFIPVNYLEAIADTAIRKVVEGASIVPSYAADYLTHVMALKQKSTGDGYTSESYIRVSNYIPKLCQTLPVVVDLLAKDLEKIEDEFLVKYFWSLSTVCPLPPVDYISFLKKVLEMVRSYVLRGRNPRIRHFLFEIVGSLVKQAPTIQGAVGLTDKATPSTSATSSQQASQQSSPSAGKRVGLADLVQFHSYVATILEEMLQSEESGLHPYCYQILAGLIQTLPSIYTIDEFYALEPSQAMASTTMKLTSLLHDQTEVQDVAASMSALKQFYYPMLRGLMSQSKWTADVASANGLSECVCAYIPRLFLYDDAREPMMKSFLDGFNIAFHQRRVSKQLSSKILLHVLASFGEGELGTWTPKILGILLPQITDNSTMVAACMCIVKYPALVSVVNQTCGLDKVLQNMLRICDQPIALQDKFALKLACDVIAASHATGDHRIQQIYDTLQNNTTIERRQREEQQLTESNFDDTSYNVLASVRDVSGAKNAIKKILVSKQLIDLAAL